MAGDSKKLQPIIVKKIKKGSHGHHGGAWKIAYADFVTAMMAFFLLMWLLGSTTEGDKKGIADYFQSPMKVAMFGASGAVMNFVGDVEARTRRIDQHLTDIMLAQDFHDLTGQVVAKVVTLATDLEDSLLKLLMQVVPPEQRAKVDNGGLQGPVVDAKGRSDVVSNQGEVDDLLASLGF